VTVTFKFDEGKKLGSRFKNRVKKFSEKQIKGVQSAARRAAGEIISRGQANMRAGGNFGSQRWQEGLQARISYTSRTDINIRVTHAVPYWRVFEYGAIIYGKPMLWIPLEFATDAKGIRARDYPLPLFRVDRPGKAPLLLSHDGGPKYFGKEKVRIPKKWDLRQITREVSREMPQYFREAMKNG
jgi:hypothetical protein